MAKVTVTNQFDDEGNLVTEAEEPVEAPEPTPAPKATKKARKAVKKS